MCVVCVLGVIGVSVCVLCVCVLGVCVLGVCVLGVIVSCINNVEIITFQR